MNEPSRTLTESFGQIEEAFHEQRMRRRATVMLACTWCSVFAVPIVYYFGWSYVRQYFEDTTGGPGPTSTIELATMLFTASTISLLGVLASIYVLVKGTWVCRLGVVPAFLLLSLFGFFSIAFFIGLE
jgi:hypothetical protein